MQSQILFIDIIEYNGSELKYKIRDSQDLGKLVYVFCQRVGRDPTKTVLYNARTGKCISMYDYGKRADAILQEGDILTEVAN